MRDLCQQVMALMKKATHAPKSANEVELTNNVLDLSVIVWFKGADVIRSDIEKLNRLLTDHYMAGVVALERGDTKNHLYFQMVSQMHIKSALAIGILAHKYMGSWYAVAKMDPKGKVCCKVLTQNQLQMFCGMIKYCRKDIRIEHFDIVMHNISDIDIIEGKTLHATFLATFGRLDLKQCLVLTHTNVIDKMYV